MAYLTASGHLRRRKRVVSVWLINDGDTQWRMYHCPDCRNAIFQYKGDIVAEVPGGAELEYPILIQCKNPNCGRRVLICYVTSQFNVVEYM